MCRRWRSSAPRSRPRLKWPNPRRRVEPAPRPPPQPLRRRRTPPQPATTAAVVDRDAAISATPRVKIETPSLTGSISLKGGRIDDLSLVKFRETVDPASPPIVLYSPSGTAEPYYAEFGWVPSAGSTVKLPDEKTMWQQE